MPKILSGDDRGRADVAAFLAAAAAAGPALGMDKSAPVHVARAPGRLDVMGGIADYSGSMVLQMPIREACFAAAQALPGTTALKVVSEPGRSFECELTELLPGGQPLEYVDARAFFAGRDATWAAYVLGAVVVLARECGATFGSGAVVYVKSDVPEGKGVSSSAAVEVSSFLAVAAAFGATYGDGRELAILCQKVENLVVGAPCGVMDQMACALGEEGKLLQLLCQPAEVLGQVTIHEGIRVWGVDSGKVHAVGGVESSGGADYGSVRVGAFMGKRILQQSAEHAELGYLANIPPSDWLWPGRGASSLPQEITGAEFVTQHATHNDAATEVDPQRTYKVLQCATHPVMEMHRVQAFAQAMPLGPASLPLLGELMRQSHVSYSLCGLGAHCTDAVVDLVKAAGTPLHGAKITGGGIGGTVCVITEADGEAAVRELCKTYETAETGGDAIHLFYGSSPGAAQFGLLKVEL